VKFTLIQYLT